MKIDLRPWSLNPDKSHPWVVEGESNVPGVKGTVCTVSYRPFAQLIAAAPELLLIASAYCNHLRTSARTDGEVATYNHIKEVIAKVSPPLGEIVCPFCGLEHGVTQEVASWAATSLDDPSNTTNINEYQCHTKQCGGRSFWI